MRYGLDLRLSPNLFWNIVYVYLRKKGRITFFRPEHIYIEYTFCKQNGEKTSNLSAAVTKAKCQLDDNLVGQVTIPQ